MTVEEYYAIVRKLGLRPSDVPNVFLTAYHEVQRVPDPTDHTPEQRAETIELLKFKLGISD